MAAGRPRNVAGQAALPRADDWPSMAPGKDVHPAAHIGGPPAPRLPSMRKAQGRHDETRPGRAGKVGAASGHAFRKGGKPRVRQGMAH